MNNIDTYISINCDQNGSSLTDGFVVSGFQTLNKFGKPVTTYEDFLSRTRRVLAMAGCSQMFQKLFRVKISRKFILT